VEMAAQEECRTHDEKRLCGKSLVSVSPLDGPRSQRPIGLGTRQAPDDCGNSSIPRKMRDRVRP